MQTQLTIRSIHIGNTAPLDVYTHGLEDRSWIRLVIRIARNTVLENCLLLNIRFQNHFVLWKCNGSQGSYFPKGQLLSCNEPDRLRLNDVFGYLVESRAGRVEICDCSSLNSGCWWATITVPTGSVTWGWKNVQVACRELYPEDYGVINPILQDTYVAN